MNITHKSQVITTSGLVGTSGVAGYLKSVTLSLASAASTVNIYDGTSTSGTLKYQLTSPNTVGFCVSSPPLSIYCASGIYCSVANCNATVEFDGC